MAQIKAYTDLEQSKTLAEILPLESADMVYIKHSSSDNPTWEFNEDFPPMILGDVPINEMTVETLPCWSLAALSEFILPYIADDDGNNYKFYLSKDGLDRWVAYYKSDDVSIHICEESDNMIDVILEMVCWLKKEEYI